MNLYLRVVSVVAAAARGHSLRPLDTSRLSFRTLPGDLDLNGHMNNGRYLSLMDLGRLDLCVRTGIYRALVDLRAKPVVASEIIRFRRSLLLGERFDLTTRILGWDQRSVYMEHRMERASEVYAIAVVRGMFAAATGIVAPGLLARRAGYEGPPPPLPEAVAAWRDTEQDLLAIQKAG